MTTLPSCMNLYINPNMFYQSNMRQTSSQPQQQPGFYPYSNAGIQSNTMALNSFMIGSYQNTSGWTGLPLISMASRRPRKSSQNYNKHVQPLNFSLLTNHRNTHVENKANERTNNNVCNELEYNDNLMSRLAIHAHGAPLILSGRFPQANKIGIHKNSIILYNGKCNTGNECQTKLGCDETPNISSSTINENLPENSLPRIIKPRKRRKRDRNPSIKKTVDTLGNNKSGDVSFALIDSISNLPVSTYNGDILIENSKSPAIIPPQLETKKHLRKNYHHEELLPPCSCRLCDPNSHIWSFPFRRPCTDKITEIGEKSHIVGVIGSNRSLGVQNQWPSSSQLLEYNISGSRKENLSDTGYSGCEQPIGEHSTNQKTKKIAYVNAAISVNLNLMDCLAYKFTDSDHILDENINDISQKMLETLDLKGDYSIKQ